MDTTVNLAAFTGTAVELLAPVLLAIATAAGKHMFDWLGLQKDAAVRAAFDATAARAIEYGRQQVTKRPGVVVEMKSDAVALAVRYVQDAVPDALKHFGITPDRLTKMIEAHW